MDMNQGTKKKNSLTSIIGIAGAILAIISLFLPFAKSYSGTESLLGIAKLYISSDSAMWGDVAYEKFYKIFVPGMIGLMVIFLVVYVSKCIKQKPVGMIVSTILTIASYEILKWDFADRRVVPGACEKGIAFAIIYVAFAVMIVGAVMMIREKKRK